MVLSEQDTDQSGNASWWSQSLLSDLTCTLCLGVLGKQEAVTVGVLGQELRVWGSPCDRWCKAGLTCRDRWLVCSGRSPGNSRRSMPPQSTTPSWEQAQSRGQLMVAGPGPGCSGLRTSTGSSSTNSFSSGLRLWAPFRPNTGALTASAGPSCSCDGSSSRSSSALLRAMVPAGGMESDPPWHLG